MTETIISSSVLIGLITLARYLLKGKISRRLQYALWLIVVIRLLLPFPLISSPFSVMNVVPSQGIQSVTKDTAAKSVQMEPSLPSDAPISNIKSDQTVNSLTRVNPATIWIFGSILVRLWFLSTNFRQAKKLFQSRTIRLDTQSRLKIYTCPNLVSPCLFGLFRPAVYLPDNIPSNSSVERHVIAHEETHFKHRDYIWGVVRGILLTIYWFNPLVWWAAIQSLRDCEIACDETTIERLGTSEKLAYSRTLLDLTIEKNTWSYIPQLQWVVAKN